MSTTSSPADISHHAQEDRGAAGRLRALGALLKDAGVRWSDDDCLSLGASLAYYAVFSIFPLLLLAVTVVGFVVGHNPEARAHLIDSVASASSPEFRTLFEDTLHNMETHQTARGVGAIVGLVTLLAGASAVFSQLEMTMNRIWRVEAKPSTGVWSAVRGLLRDKAMSFAIVVGAAVALLASIVVSAMLTSVSQVVEGVVPGTVAHATLWIVVELIGSVGLLSVIFAAMFRLIPQTDVAWRDVLGGAVLTAVLFTSTKRLLAWYLGHLGSYAAYGAVGGFLGLLTWIYLSSLFLFYGAEFSRLFAERYGSLSRGPSTPPGARAASGSHDVVVASRISHR